MRQKVSDPGAFDTRRVATEAAMLEDILDFEFNTLGELRSENCGLAKALPSYRLDPLRVGSVR